MNSKASFAPIPKKKCVWSKPRATKDWSGDSAKTLREFVLNHHRNGLIAADSRHVFVNARHAHHLPIKTHKSMLFFRKPPMDRESTSNQQLSTYLKYEQRKSFRIIARSQIAPRLCQSGSHLRGEFQSPPTHHTRSNQMKMQ